MSSTSTAIDPGLHIRDDEVVFKVEGDRFSTNRAPLDNETDKIPRGQDPIELTNVKAGDFEILLNFLNLGYTKHNSSTRYDKKPLTAVDWASVIAVSSVLGMQRVLTLACKALLDPGLEIRYHTKLADFESMLALLNLRYAPPLGFSDVIPPPQPPTYTTAITSRQYVRDDVAVFKVEGHLFRINRAPLDKETEKIPRGEDPIELTNIKRGDFEVLLDFLNLGTRHDKKPLTAVDWASVIAVSSALGMQRVLTLSCKTLSDPQLEIRRAGAGFDTATRGMYFLIREKDTANYLITPGFSNVEGSYLQLWKLGAEKTADYRAQVFFIDSYGALCHAASGLAVDIIDNVLVLRRRQPVSGIPNPWSHPLPEFSFVNSQIQVKFLSDPSFPRCTDNLYPDSSWATKKFVLAAHNEQAYHVHPISDFLPWIPSPMAGSFEYNHGRPADRECRVLVEETTEDVGGKRTSWEIVRATQS